MRSGTVSTLVGNCTNSGYVDGPPSKALLDGAGSVIFVSSTLGFFTDIRNHAIRSITLSNGAVTNVSVFAGSLNATAGYAVSKTIVRNLIFLI